MQLKSTVPNIVLEAGLPSRFRYWSGRSGLRYLFTLTDLAALDHFDDAVAIVARYGRIIWAGQIPVHDMSAIDLCNLAAREDAQIYVHLLARSTEQRAAIIDDLRDVIQISQVEHRGTARILEFPTAA